MGSARIRILVAEPTNLFSRRRLTEPSQTNMFSAPATNVAPLVLKFKMAGSQQAESCSGSTTPNSAITPNAQGAPDIRRVTVTDPEAMTFSDLLQRAATSFGSDKALRFTFVDDEGDVCTLSCTEELQEAIALNRSRLSVAVEVVGDAAGAKEPSSEEAAAKVSFQELSTALDEALERLRASCTSDSDFPQVVATMWQAVKQALVASGFADVHLEVDGPSGRMPLSLDHVLSVVRQFAPTVCDDSATASSGSFGGNGGAASHGGGSSDRPRPMFGGSGASTATQHPTQVHFGVICDACNANPLRGKRFKATNRHDYDLCEVCHKHRADICPGVEFEELAAPSRGGLFGGFGGFGRPGTRVGIPFGASPVFAGNRRACGGRGRGGAPCKPFPKHHNKQESNNVMPCHQKSVGPGARFVCDVTVCDGTIVAPGEHFVKIWRVRNCGSAPWPEGCTLTYNGPLQPCLKTSANTPITLTLASGAEGDVFADIETPETPGRYVGYWRFALPDGRKIGQRIWADFIVQSPNTDSSDSDDVVAMASNAGNEEPPSCESTSLKQDGSAAANGAPGSSKKKPSPASVFTSQFLAVAFGTLKTWLKTQRRALKLSFHAGTLSRVQKDQLKRILKNLTDVVKRSPAGNGDTLESSPNRHVFVPLLESFHKVASEYGAQISPLPSLRNGVVVRLGVPEESGGGDFESIPPLRAVLLKNGTFVLSSRIDADNEAFAPCTSPDQEHHARGNRSPRVPRGSLRMDHDGKITFNGHAGPMAQWRVHTSGQNDELIRLSNVNGAHQGLYLGVDKTSGDVVSTVLGNPGVHVDFKVSNISREQVEAHLAKQEKEQESTVTAPVSDGIISSIAHNSCVAPVSTDKDESTSQDAAIQLNNDHHDTPTSQSDSVVYSSDEFMMVDADGAVTNEDTVVEPAVPVQCQEDVLSTTDQQQQDSEQQTSQLETKADTRGVTVAKGLRLSTSTSNESQSSSKAPSTTNCVSDSAGNTPKDTETTTSSTATSDMAADRVFAEHGFRDKSLNEMVAQKFSGDLDAAIVHLHAIRERHNDLARMGFTNEARNMKLLLENDNSLDATLNVLLS